MLNGSLQEYRERLHSKNTKHHLKDKKSPPAPPCYDSLHSLFSFTVRLRRTFKGLQ